MTYYMIVEGARFMLCQVESELEQIFFREGLKYSIKRRNGLIFGVSYITINGKRDQICNVVDVINQWIEDND